MGAPKANVIAATLLLMIPILTCGCLMAEECQKSIKYDVGQRSFDRAKNALYLHVSVPEKELTRTNLVELACHWKKKYRTVETLSISVFTTLYAAKITDFTYEQQGYPELENAYRAHYFLDRKSNVEYVEFTSRPLRKGESMERIPLSSATPNQ